MSIIDDVKDAYAAQVKRNLLAWGAVIVMLWWYKGSK